MSRIRSLLLGIVVVTITALPASAAPVAEQVTALNAGATLFGGTDADGGIDDWYLSNGVVELIVDDVGPQADLVPLLGASAPPKTSEFAFTGCSMIDLGRVGAENDQLSQQFIVGGLSTSNFVLYDSISSSVSGSEGKITCTGAMLGFDSGATPVPPSNLPVVTEFIVDGSDPFVSLRTTVTNTHPTNSAAGLGGFLDVFLWTIRAQIPFTPLPNRGFHHVELNLSNPVGALELPAFAAAPGVLGPADGTIDPITGLPSGETSYGLMGVETSFDPDGGGPTAPTVSQVNTLFGVSSNLLTAFGNVPGPSLPPGGVLTYERRFYVGDRNDVASVANFMIAERASRFGLSTGTISGDVDADDAANVPASGVAIASGAVAGFAANTVVTHFRTDASGAFSGVVLPVGTYDITFKTPERDDVTVAGVVVSAGADTPVAPPSMSSQGTLHFQVLEKVPGPDPLVPAKITFVGIKGTPNPRFGHDVDALLTPAGGGADVDLIPESFGGGSAQGNMVYLVDGTGTVRLRPGRYEVWASHGPEYTIRRKRVAVKPGRERKVKLKIAKVVDTTNLLSADFHVHSGRSLDTQAGLVDRVVSFVGEGVELMVSTDHDFHVDYAPVIAALGVENEITSIVGNEVTGSVPNPPAFPDSYGHINAWPLTVVPDARRDGSIEEEFVAPNMIYKRLRDQGAEVIQYNHVRAGLSGITSIGFFNNFGYDPTLAITSPPNDLLLDDDILGPGISGVANPDSLRNLDFDVMEIMNSGSDVSAYLAVRRDWLSLLNQTDFSVVPFIGGTAVSDSHRITVEHAGYGRTYVGGVGDDPAALSVPAFNTQVTSGNMIGTTGPIIRFSIRDATSAVATLGDVFHPATSQVVLQIQVDAAPWVEVDQVRVVSNGFTTMTFDTTTTPAVKKNPKPRSQSRGKVRRFDEEIVVTLGADTYFVVEAGAVLEPTLPTPPEASNIILPGVIPVAFTNPIFVDLAGDGFDPPGLPVMAKSPKSLEDVPAFARYERPNQPWLAGAWTWLTERLASLTTASTAVAHEPRKDALTGTALAEQIDRERDQVTQEYFPLHRFEIPQSAVDEAIDELPEPERSQARAAREGKKR